MQKPIYIIIGCPGSGKSWVCEQLKDKFQYIAHDSFIPFKKEHNKEYLKAINNADKSTQKSLIIEAPFGVSQTTAHLVADGHKVIPVYIQEKPGVIESRYQKRDNKPIPQGHITRQKSYLSRAQEQKAFVGTSEEVLNHLKSI